MSSTFQSAQRIVCSAAAAILFASIAVCAAVPVIPVA